MTDKNPGENRLIKLVGMGEVSARLLTTRKAELLTDAPALSLSPTVCSDRSCPIKKEAR